MHRLLAPRGHAGHCRQLFQLQSFEKHDPLRSLLSAIHSASFCKLAHQMTSDRKATSKSINPLLQLLRLGKDGLQHKQGVRCWYLQVSD